MGKPLSRFRRDDTLSPSEVLQSINTEFSVLFDNLKDDGFSCLDDLSGTYQGSARGWLSCGIPALDWVFGKGLPYGRVIEMFGRESSGKTSLAVLYAAACQRIGGVAGMLDTEQSAMPDRFRQLGLNTGAFLYYESTPDNLLTIESCYRYLEKIFLKCYERDPSLPTVMIWDSIAATPTSSDLEAEVGEQSGGMAEAARYHSQGLRKITQIISATNSILILVNQSRDKFGPMAQGGQTQPGGRAIKFYSSIRAELKDLYGVIHHDVNGQVVGKGVTLRTVKNKVTRPYRSVNIDVFLDSRGYDRVHSTLCLLKELGQVGSAGSKGSKLVIEDKTMIFKGDEWEKTYYENERLIVDFVKTFV